MSKVIIVEGKSDKDRVEELLDEPVAIICSNGTISYDKLEEWADLAIESEIYLLTDADASGEKLRKKIKQVIPTVRHLYTSREFREVATTPREILRDILLQAHFAVRD